MAPVGQLGVLGAGQAQRDRTLDGHDELGTDPAGLLVGGRRVRLVDDDLGDPVPVAQVQEDQLAVVAPPVDPARTGGRRPPRRSHGARRRCGSGRAWRGWGGGRSWSAYGSRTDHPEPDRRIDDALDTTRPHDPAELGRRGAATVLRGASWGSRRSPSDRARSCTRREPARSSPSRGPAWPRAGRTRRWRSPSTTSRPRWPTCAREA